MTYDNVVGGKFISRPNRFIAKVYVNGNEEVCHVKNTGRCREILLPGADVFLQRSDKTDRKTKFDLISVYKGNELINIDSQAPNKVFGEWATQSGFFGKIDYIKPEYTYKNSRFDFYIEAENKKILVEVKGVTLEENGVVSFPDAPTERGIKHINELLSAKADGFEAYLFFIIQMEKCRHFTPNREKHPEFADALEHASKNGVEIRALNCKVSKQNLDASGFVEVRI